MPKEQVTPKTAKLTVGDLQKILEHLDPKSPLWTGGMFSRCRIVGVNIDDDGTVCILNEGEVETGTRYRYGNMVTPEGIHAGIHNDWAPGVKDKGKKHVYAKRKYVREEPDL